MAIQDPLSTECAAFGAKEPYTKIAYRNSIFCLRFYSISDRAIPEECDYGALSTLILKPSEVRYEKIFTNMARFKRKIGSVVRKSIEKVKRKKPNPNSVPRIIEAMLL